MQEDVLGEELDFLDENYETEQTYEDIEGFMTHRKATDLNAWTSLILGIIGSLGWLIPIIGVPVTIVGTALGAVSMKAKTNRGIAIAGFVINTVFLTAAIAKGIVDIIFYLKKTNR